MAEWILQHWEMLLFIGVAIILATVFWIQQDLLAKLDERCNAAWSDIDALLVQRHDMIPPLVETVKGFMKHEASVLGDVIRARAMAMRAVGPEKVEAESQLGASLATLFNVTEDYPEIAASTHFRELQNELVRIEDKLTAARSFYNLSVEEMNGTRRTFPSNLVGWIARIEKRVFFTLSGPREQYERRAEVSF
jgi:LemA protein